MNSRVGQFAALASMLVLAPPSAHAQEPFTAALNPMNIEFMSGPIAFDSEPVEGAPYSAEAVTEVVQTLADGNRIVRESKAEIARDGKGRTRRDQGLAMFGPLVGGPGGNGEPRHVQISDPVTKTTIVLDLEARTAHRIPVPQFKLADTTALPRPDAGSATIEHFEMALPATPAGAPHAVKVFRSQLMTNRDEAVASVTEDLGVQFMEGVAVQGTRTTATIPAGQIGNELPIKIVSERWFSPELKVLVMSRQSDPRFGETNYRLTNLTRTEPPPQLFEVPSDFTMIEPSNANVVIERRIITK